MSIKVIEARTPVRWLRIKIPNEPVIKTKSAFFLTISSALRYDSSSPAIKIQLFRHINVYSSGNYTKKCVKVGLCNICNGWPNGFCLVSMLLNLDVICQSYSFVSPYFSIVTTPLNKRVPDVLARI